MKKKYPKGFTLIELMVVLAIVAIIASVGWPLFVDYDHKQQRSEAVSLLTNLRLEMERCMSSQADPANIGTYTGCGPTAIGNTVIRGRYYNAPAIAVADDGLSYTITATHTTGLDTDCTSLTIDNLGAKSNT
ncbi:MAG: prepilin-type N-terminal cleavage/methylation domain-containing protein, partial [Gammaproteobacteria bacterium]|nr:prepilin-type N-terminal cleavage/methylation domain-containing protein [Gammaproteobacteria bacterium]